MNKEDLLQKRYKVIADYPYTPFEIGVILISDENDEAYSVDHGFTLLNKRVKFSEIHKYPHLFKELEWWEDRKPEDMPEYIKSNSTGGVFKYNPNRHDSYNWKNITASAEQEYNEYQRSLPNETT